MVPKKFELPSGSSPSDFHITLSENGAPIIHVADIDGNLYKAEYSCSEWNILYEKRISKKPLRNLSVHGDVIFLTSSSGNIFIIRSLNEVSKTKRIRDSDGEPAEISSFCLVSSESDLLDPNQPIVVTVGDDNGNVYVLKLSSGSDTWEQVMLTQEQDDSITKLIYHPYRKMLLASSADGTLVVLDLKKYKIIAHTSSLDDEILSMIMDHNDNVVCSTGLGSLVRYKWGYWGKVSGRLKPSFHSSASINSIVVSDANQNLLFTGTVDGNIRSVSLYPELSLLGSHHTLDDSIELIKAVTFDQLSFVVVSLTNDSCLFFLSVQPKPEVKPVVEVDSDASDHEPKPKQAKKVKKEPVKTTNASALESFFAGLE